MRYKLTFITGAAVGFVIGARAGRERYEQLVKAGQAFVQNPAVRNAAESAAQQSRTAAVKAADTVTAKVGPKLPKPLADKVRAMHNGGAPADDWGTSNT
ncbi:YtxH domain-containing protein [Actinacidiphila epipremni]|uniref:YtxH domain-containing protein n=1 Tax=Actinacidiphila epipremni TaxID=2053013 RepID=A0ABX0ZIE4_9ACTN|nr:YtxH domain-containing protein [Actinacidiphila epipremni]NJP42207.1 YtxH domain-containing protein [Actinacidiphila epipremni]